MKINYNFEFRGKKIVQQCVENIKYAQATGVGVSVECGALILHNGVEALQDIMIETVYLIEFANQSSRPKKN